MPVVSDGNTNLSPAEKELLRWHQHLGHIAFKKVQQLMKSGVLAHSEATCCLHCIACRLPPVKCAACQYAKQRVRSIPGTATNVIQNCRGVISQGNLPPGQEVCINHFICSIKGRLFTSCGSSKDSDIFMGGAVFIDQASGYVHVEHQSKLASHSTLCAKESFQAICRDHEVIPQNYLSDNSAAFTNTEYCNSLSQFRQIQCFAGTDAHHHNSRAKRAIQMIMLISHVMMMHAFLHQPDMEDISLGPWLLCMRPTFGILCPIQPLAFALLMCSAAQNLSIAKFWIFMSLDTHCMFSTSQFLMARRSQGGNHGHIGACIWEDLQVMQVPCHQC